MCGEKVLGEPEMTIMEGSPPRVRGKEVRPVRRKRRIRITPACAGKSSTIPTLRLGHQDHPRVCGEKSTRRFLGSAVTGSPPRVRGKVLYLYLLLGHIRITPACAGKSRACLALSAAAEDHPRVCGEKHYTTLVWAFVLGSPPRVRGKVLLSICFVCDFRITPACAGKRLK